MPRRTDLKRVLVIGSGPIVIGQACEFDYSGTQACKALRAEGLEVVLVNSNPATIMTDPELADRTYVEPLTVGGRSRRSSSASGPDALLPTVGGQTALNLAVDLAERRRAREVQRRADRRVDRGDQGRRGPAAVQGRDARDRPRRARRAAWRARSTRRSSWRRRSASRSSSARRSRWAASAAASPTTSRSSASSPSAASSCSPVHEVLIEESVIGWKEFELEVMRDVADNFVVICSIENIDPMGVHTGDSITVAPILTLTDKEYQRMRDAARRIIRKVGVETGGSNIQFAVNPADGRMVVIEMNPRVSRSSALASKATGFPIAKIAAKLALGYHLDEIPNDITRLTPASFEPTIDYVVVKIPRWNFEKFPQADRTLTTQMKSVGEAMAIGRTFKEAFMKGVRSLELGTQRPAVRPQTRSATMRRGRRRARCGKRLAMPNDRRMWDVFRALDRGWTVEQIHELTQDRSVVPAAVRRDRRAAAAAAARRAATASSPRSAAHAEARRLRRSGARAGHRRPTRRRSASGARELGLEAGLQARRHLRRRVRVVHAVSVQLVRADAAKSNPNARDKVVILGSGPNRIGQGIEFDYCCCHAAFALREEGFETVMINCNPETVSTDYDTADRLYFQPLTFEDVMAVIETERSAGGEVSCLVQFGGQTPLKLALALQEAGVRILGTSPDSIDLAEDRKRFAALLSELGHPAAGERHRDVAGGSARGRRRRSASRSSSGRRTCSAAAAMAIVYDVGDARSLHDAARSTRRPSIRCWSTSSSRTPSSSTSTRSPTRPAPSSSAASWSTSRRPASTPATARASCRRSSVPERHLATIRDYTRRIARALKVVGLMNVQYAIKDDVVYVLEVNPRASRTVPYLSKATGVPLAKIAAQGDGRADARASSG